MAVKGKASVRGGTRAGLPARPPCRPLTVPETPLSLGPVAIPHPLPALGPLPLSLALSPAVDTPGAGPVAPWPRGPVSVGSGLPGTLPPRPRLGPVWPLFPRSSSGPGTPPGPGMRPPCGSPLHHYCPFLLFLPWLLSRRPEPAAPRQLAGPAARPLPGPRGPALTPPPPRLRDLLVLAPGDPRPRRNLSLALPGHGVRLWLFPPAGPWPRTPWEVLQLGGCLQAGPRAAPVPAACRTYFSYRVNVTYHGTGLSLSSLSLHGGPLPDPGLPFRVEPILFHLFSAHSPLLSPGGTLTLSWSLRPLGRKGTGFQVLQRRGGPGPWKTTFNPYAVVRHPCPSDPAPSGKMAAVDLCFLGQGSDLPAVGGELGLSDATAGFRVSANSAYLALNPRGSERGAFFVGPSHGLLYSPGAGKEGGVSGERGAPNATRHLFYQRQGLSFLFALDLVGLRRYRLGVHVFLNQRGASLRALADRDIEIHFYNSGPAEPQGPVYLVWFIPLQHPLSPQRWTFKLRLLGPGADLASRGTYTYGDRVPNASRFVPRSVLPFDPDLYSGFVAKTNCSHDGSRPAVLEATVPTYASKVLESSVSCQRSRCVIEKVKITKPSVPQPIFSVDQHLPYTLFSRVAVDCPGALSVNLTWRVFSVQNLSTDPSDAEPLDTSSWDNRNSSIFYLPAYTLRLGTYLFNLTVTVIPPEKGAPLLEDSDFVFVDIQGRDLKAVIAGGSKRTVGVDDTWTLDGSASMDLDAVDPSAGLSFTWYCTTKASNLKKMPVPGPGRETCLSSQVDLRWIWPSDPVQTVLPRTLQSGRAYYFRLVVQKDRSTALADQTVIVQSGSTPEVSLNCIENCAKTLIPTNRFSLAVNCSNCDKVRPAYLWSLLSSEGTEIRFDWLAKTSTGRRGAYLTIKSLAFADSVDLSYILSLRTTSQSGVSSVSNYSFFVNSAPRAGRCLVSPLRGLAFLTKFIIQCRGFTDDNLPLSYKMIASDLTPVGTITTVEENTLGTVLYSGPWPTMPPSFLPVGVPSRQFTVTIHVQVSDSLGAFTQVTLHATVQPLTKRQSPETVLDEVHGATHGANATLTTLLRSGDFVRAGNLIYTASTVINHIADAPGLRASKARLRTSLLNKTAGLPTSSLTEMNQIVSSVTQLTQKAAEISEESRTIASRRLAEVSRVLQDYRQKEKTFHSEEIDILSTGILASTRNVLRANLSAASGPNEEVVGRALSVLDTLADTVLLNKMPGENQTVMRAGTWTIHLWKDEKRDLSSGASRQEGCRNCFYPTLGEESGAALPSGAHVSTVFYEFEEDPFRGLDRGDPRVPSTAVVGLKMTGAGADGEAVRVVPRQVEFIVARKDSNSAFFNLTVGPHKRLRRTTTGGFNFEMNRDYEELSVQIVTRVKTSFAILLYLGRNVSAPPLTRFLAPPDRPPSILGSGSPSPNCTIRAPYVLCLPRSLLEALVPGLRSPNWNLSVVLRARRFVRRRDRRLVTISLFVAHCLAKEGPERQWREDACLLGRRTDWRQVHCLCQPQGKVERRAVTAGPSRRTLAHKTLFLAGRLIVPPNPVDLEQDLIAALQKNVVTLLAVLVITLVYIALAFWAINRDIADRLLRERVVVLPDNDPFDKVCYLVSVYTGSRAGAGTTADVFVQIIGTQGASEAHCLRHPDYRPFLRGRADSFLLTTRRDLGDVYSLRVWHNNRGGSPHWYLSRVKVENLFTKQAWHFICRQWLAVDKGDRLLERSFVATHPEVPLARTDFFLIEVAGRLAGDHIWFSVFVEAVPGQFGRLQRLSCCLAVLLSTLLSNIMFFNIDENQEAVAEDRQYLRSLMIGIESVLITMPVQMVISTLFASSQAPPVAPEPVEPPGAPPPPAAQFRTWKEHLQSWYTPEPAPAAPADGAPPPAPAGAGPPPGRQKSNCAVPEATANAIAESEDGTGAARGPATPPPAWKNANNNAEAGGAGAGQGPRQVLRIICPCRPPELVFHWWCVYVAWGLVILTSCLSSFFIILYGLSYGYRTSLEWLLASASSFGQSVFLIQPFRILTLCAARTAVPKLTRHISWTGKFNYQEIQLEGVPADADEQREAHRQAVRARNSREYRPLEEDEIRIIQKRKRIETQASSFLKDFVGHFVFLALIVNIVSSLENTNSFHSNQVLARKFSVNLSAVSKLEHVYGWLDGVLVPLLHHDHHPGWLADSWSKILGWPRMRQVRARPGPVSCFSPFRRTTGPGPRCLPRFGRDPEDTRSYSDSWAEGGRPGGPSFTYQADRNHWAYQSTGVLRHYGPGGYPFYFFPEELQFNSSTRLQELRQRGWLDERTWAVIVELTTLNPDVSLFGCVSVVFEASPLGVVNASLTVHSFTLPLFHKQSRVQLLAYVALLVFLCVYLLDEIHVVRREKAAYVRRTSNLINFVLKSAFLLFFLFYVAKFRLAHEIVALYLLNPHSFVPFHSVAHVDQTVRVTLGFLVFMTVLKTLEYSRFFYDVRLAQRSILAALPGICSMALVVAVYFFVYMAFGYLVFGQYEWNYNSMVHSAQTVFSYCVSAFRDTAFSSNRLLGGLFLASFMLVMICVLINLFQAVILSAYEDMKQPVYEEPSDEAEAMNYLVHRLRRLYHRLTRRSPRPEDTEFWDNVFYGQPKRRSRRYLGLKTRKINGKKMVYLVV
ncbi:polycystic kidney disease and receptor for egg jelly-related protein [Ornithorhynchus anatinus]|uniref:polycystic kidney disease and receptor for egg jelly-related protein n=1 Tax=Ornithorhynchus anatinus TaxID=9258 RepID=UPI0010A8F777|nr:polycystic kidney disease and receptor for egg jelly-related protein [Ornithorhynchus anatinus]